MQTAAIVYKDTQGKEYQLKSNSRFLNYSANFKNLLKTQPIVTMYPLVTMAISYDSTLAMSIAKKNDRESWIKMYDLNTGDLTFEEKIGGLEDSFIKCKEIEQNEDGSRYAVCFNDDGKFRLRFFGKKSRTDD